MGYFDALAASLEEPKPRPNSPEVFFAEGVAAFRAGLPLTANPYPRLDWRHTEWEFGWQIRQMGKRNEFQEYEKARTLFDRRYCPPGREPMLHSIQTARQRTIARYEGLYPEFPRLYDNFKRRGR